MSAASVFGTPRVGCSWTPKQRHPGERPDSPTASQQFLPTWLLQTVTAASHTVLHAVCALGPTFLWFPGSQGGSSALTSTGTMEVQMCFLESLLTPVQTPCHHTLEGLPCQQAEWANISKLMLVGTSTLNVVQASYNCLYYLFHVAKYDWQYWPSF